MSRKSDLERSIRESYSLVREYEEIIRLSDRPREKLHAKHEIEEQWTLIEGYMAEYSLVGDDVPNDIAQVSRRVRSWKDDLEQFSAPALVGSWEDRRAYRNRQAMLKLVEQFWVKGVLEQSLHGAAMIELGMEERIDAIDHPWDMVLQVPAQPAQCLPPGTKIVDVFEQVDHALLILGEPGSGKTTMLLELARDAIARAQGDPTQPIPAVFNLSSWTDPRQSLAEWVVEELNVKYKVAKKIGRTWVGNDALLLLLDGLDEVKSTHRERCVVAINRFRRAHGLASIVICSRTREYEALVNRLELNGAFVIEPLTREQIDDYVTAAGSRLGAFRRALQLDDTLQELAQRPLMLNVMGLAYRDLAIDDIAPAQRDLEKRRKHLFGLYVERMFTRIVRTQRADYPKEQTIRWLSWLADGMLRHAQTVFLVEQLQPSWLSALWQRWSYAFVSRLVVALGAGLLLGTILALAKVSWVPGSWLVWGPGYGLSIGLAVGLVDAVRLEQSCKSARNRWSPKGWYPAVQALSAGIAYGVAVFVVVFGLLYAILTRLAWPDQNWLFAGLQYGAVYGSVFGLILGSRSYKHSPKRDIRTVESYRFSWVRALRGFAVGLVLGLCLGLVASIVDIVYSVVAGQGTLSISQVWLARTGSSDWVTWLRSVVGHGITFSLATSTFGTVFAGLSGREMETNIRPNEGIRLSARNAAVAMLLLGPLGALIILLVTRFAPSPVWLLEFYGPVYFGVAGGLVAAIWHGGLDVAQHFCLRVVLFCAGYMPWRYVRFLDYASYRIFLLKVGGGYIFVHRLLQDYFAELWDRERGERV
jgi:hypothetical protein